MIQNVYSKKMFVIDLIITSIWAFFNLRVSLWGGWLIPINILMRLALCFQMQRKSPWTLYSAVAFLFCGGGLAFTDNASYPFKRLAYYIGTWMGNGTDVVEAFGGELDSDLRVWLTIFGAMLSLWIYGLPIIIGLVQQNIKTINWKHKWILFYLVTSCILSVPIFYEEILIGLFMLGFVLCFLPLVYWTIYNRNHRSVFNLICKYKPLVVYVTFIVLLALCLFIGMERWEFIKALALIIMPSIFYALICRCQNIKPLTRHAAALSICGILYYFIFTAPEWFKIITLSLSGILALYVAIDVAHKDGYYWTGVILFLMPTVVVSPLTLGMNPYVLLDTDSVSDYYYGYDANDGIFIIEKNGKYGLRDRFGLVLEPNYEKFEKLDKWGRYITTNTCNGSMLSDNRYGVFDLGKYEFILDPNEAAVMKIVQTGKLDFNLYSPDDSIFATLHIRGYNPETGEYIRNTYLEPYHSSTELNLEENPELSEWEKDLGDCQQGDNAESYVLVDKARVAINRQYNEIIQHDSTYRKVYDRWSDLMKSMSSYLVDVTYGKPNYSLQPLQINQDIRQWYEAMLPEVRIDKEILLGDRQYTSSINTSVSSTDYEKFFYQFKPKRPGGYNRMWNEIQPAFNEWRSVRAEYAEDLDPHKKLSYEEHTDLLTYYLFNQIKDLLINRNDNKE